MKDIVALCKRRGFIFPASEIYGGINGFWDYGPLGTELKNNIRDLWWNDMVKCPPLDENGEPLRIYGIDSSIIQNPAVWKASGHLDNFSDPMVDCKTTKSRYRADHVEVYVPKDLDGVAFAFMEGEEENKIAKKIKKLAKGKGIEDYEKTPLPSLELSYYGKVIAPDTDEVGTLTDPKSFNLMFETKVGAVANESNIAYLRPETAQGIFINYRNVVDSIRPRLPFGIAQIGKAFRNEVTPRNFIFRSREFEQMELQWFCSGSDAAKWQEFWLDQRYNWWKGLGLDAERLQLRSHDQDELAHYAKLGNGTKDIEYKFPFSGDGFSELEGVAHRCNFDLSQHQQHSGVKQEYHDLVNNTKFIPDVIEPSSGLTRGVLAVLCNAYKVEEQRPSGAYLNLHPSIAPVKAAIMPLQSKGDEAEMAHKIFLDLRKTHMVTYEDKQSIGKRYAKNDEIGTPFCMTVDSDSLSKGDVTIRDRNTMQQTRVSVDQLKTYLDNAMQRGNSRNINHITVRCQNGKLSVKEKL